MTVSRVFLKPADEDFMQNYRPGVMEFDEDGNYTSIFEGKDGKYKFNHIDGPRLKRRQALLEKKKARDKEASKNLEIRNCAKEDNESDTDICSL